MIQISSFWTNLKKNRRRRIRRREQLRNSLKLRHSKRFKNKFLLIKIRVQSIRREWNLISPDSKITQRSEILVIGQIFLGNKLIFLQFLLMISSRMVYSLKERFSLM